MPAVDLVPARRFNTLDGMILVAALAVWLSIVPGSLVNVPRFFREGGDAALQLSGLSPRTSPGTTRVLWSNAHVAIHNVVAPWPLLFGHLVPAVLIMGLRRPRPPRSQLVRRPGFAALLLLCLYPVARLELWWLLAQRIPPGVDAAFAGVLFWVVLGSPPWRAEPTWLDRLGRSVAGYWIIDLLIRATDHTLLGCGG